MTPNEAVIKYEEPTIFRVGDIEIHGIFFVRVDFVEDVQIKWYGIEISEEDYKRLGGKPIGELEL